MNKYNLDAFLDPFVGEVDDFIVSTKKNLELRIAQLEIFLDDFVDYANTALSDTIKNYFGEEAFFDLKKPEKITFEKILLNSYQKNIARIHMTGRVPVEMLHSKESDEFYLLMIYQSDFRQFKPPAELLWTEFSGFNEGEKQFITSFRVSEEKKKTFDRISEHMIPYIIQRYYPNILEDVTEFVDYFYSKLEDQLNALGFSVSIPGFNLNHSSLRYDAEKDILYFDHEFKHHADASIKIADKNTAISFNIPYPSFRYRNRNLTIFPGNFDGGRLKIEQNSYDSSGLMVAGALAQAYDQPKGVDILPDNSLSYEDRIVLRDPLLVLPKEI